jgi:hypothetical protein
MSIYGLESALNDITTKSPVRQRFAAEPDAALSGYVLEASEQSMLKALDLGGAAADGPHQPGFRQDGP